MSALDAARRVADAVLYEGYLLYPYRASASKNQVRWQFGVLGPIGAAETAVGEEPSIFTECLLEPTAEIATIDLHLRFLQSQWRRPQRCVDASSERYDAVDELRVGDANWIAWHEAVEREIVVTGLSADAIRTGHQMTVDIPGGNDVELLHDSSGAIVGRLVRTRYPLSGRLRVSATTDATAPSLLRVKVEVENVASLEATNEVSRTLRRDLAARQSFIGTHLLLVAHGSRFVSIVNPPPEVAAAASRCGNARCWAFLAGTKANDERTSEILLGSPIILGDFPAIADESPGQLFDSAEIDEILTLRIMTMTDEEKAAARGTDPRAAAIIDRTDGMPPEVFERLHGSLRSFDPTEFPTISSTFDDSGNLTSAPWFSEAADAAVTPDTDVVMINGVPVSRDSRVRLRPCRRADAHDMFLAGQIARVRRIDLDVDGTVHVAVLLEDDPAADLHDWHGRYYYFGIEEIEPLAPVDSRGPR